MMTTYALPTLKEEINDIWIEKQVLSKSNDLSWIYILTKVLVLGYQQYM